MAKSDRYYHFPLSLLAMTNDRNELHDAIAAYTFSNKADSFVQNNEIHEHHKERIYNQLDSGLLEDFEIYSFDYEENELTNFIYMAAVFGFTVKEAENLYFFSEDVGRYLFEDEQEFISQKDNAYVRVRHDIVSDYKNGIISENNFRVFCGILSVLGDDPIIAITYDTLRIRASGYKSREKWNYIEKRYPEKQLVISKPSVAKATDNLEEKGFITKICYKNRYNYYSLSKDINEIRRLMLGKVTRHLKRKQKVKKLEAELNNLTLEDLHKNAQR